MAYSTREEILQLFGEPEVRNKIDTVSVTTRHASIWSLALRYSRNVLQQDGLDVDTPLLRGRFELNIDKRESIRWFETYAGSMAMRSRLTIS